MSHVTTTTTVVHVTVVGDGASTATTTVVIASNSVGLCIVMDWDNEFLPLLLIPSDTTMDVACFDTVQW